MKKILHPRIRSYVLRQGRITPSQRRAMETCWPDYGLTISEVLADLDKIFGRRAPCVLEIGFGNGESLLTQALESPEKNFIGIEVHTPGVGHLMAEAKRLALKNLRVYQADAVSVLSQCIPDASLDTLQIFFPDPWHKKRHHKRRLIQNEFVNLLACKLKQGGVLHCATDWENYAEQMMCVISASKAFDNPSGKGSYFSDAYSLRPITKFERRGINLNHGIRDLVFVRNQHFPFNY